MNHKDEFKVTTKVIQCKNCGYRVVQSEVDQNKGKCPNCNEEFKPLSK